MSPAHVGINEEVARVFAELKKNPAMVLGKAGRLGDILRARWIFHRCVLGHGVAARGRVRLNHPERMTFGNRVTFLGGMVPTELFCSDDAALHIGDDVVVNYGASIHANIRVEIGPRSMLASFVRISDHARDRRGPVTLGSDVWVAHGAIIEPGVTIGHGSVVSAGSVVTRDIPPNTLAIGNPARAMSLDLMG